MEHIYPGDSATMKRLGWFLCSHLKTLKGTWVLSHLIDSGSSHNLSRSPLLPKSAKLLLVTKQDLLIAF